jgi:hypothetical protein
MDVAAAGIIYDVGYSYLVTIVDAETTPDADKKHLVLLHDQNSKQRKSRKSQSFSSN